MSGAGAQGVEAVTLESLRAELRRFASEDLGALGDRLECILRDPELRRPGARQSLAQSMASVASTPPAWTRATPPPSANGDADEGAPPPQPARRTRARVSTWARQISETGEQVEGTPRENVVLGLPEEQRSEVARPSRVSRRRGSDSAGAPIGIKSALLSRADSMVASSEMRDDEGDNSDDGGEALKWVRTRKGYGGVSSRATVRQSKPGAAVAQRATVRPGTISAAVRRATQARLRAEGRQEEDEEARAPTERVSARSQTSDGERRASAVSSHCLLVPTEFEDLKLGTPRFNQIDSQAHGNGRRASHAPWGGFNGGDDVGSALLHSPRMQSSPRDSDDRAVCPPDVEQERRWWTGSLRLEAIVLSPTFECVASVFVIINSVAIGIHTEVLARNEPDWACNLVERGFICVFAVELCLRIAAEGVGFFLREGEQGWANILDGLVVVLQVFKEAVEFQSGAVFFWGSNSLGILRVFRVTRLIRVSNDPRLFNILSDLRTMVVSVSDSFLSLVWTIALLTLFTFVFGVFLTQLVADFLRLGSRAAVEEAALKKHFGSLQSTMLSMYEASTGGINWHEMVDPLLRISPLVVVVFLCYMFFVIFALTNVVTGVFVESALRTAESDKRRQLTHQMSSLFSQADDDGNGTITWEEFQEHLAAPQLQSFLKALDLHVDEARALFQLLDVDDSGEIDADELVQGCLRLDGQAKAIELAAFMHEYRRTVRRAKVHEELVEKSLAWLCERLQAQQ